MIALSSSRRAESRDRGWRRITDEIVPGANSVAVTA